MQVDERGFWMNEHRRARRRRLALAGASLVVAAATTGALVLLRQPGAEASRRAEAPRRARSTAPAAPEPLTARSDPAEGATAVSVPTEAPHAPEGRRTMAVKGAHASDETSAKARLLALLSSADHDAAKASGIFGPGVGGKLAGASVGDASGLGGLGTRRAGRGTVGLGSLGLRGGGGGDLDTRGGGYVPRGEVKLGAGEILGEEAARRPKRRAAAHTSGLLAALAAPKKASVPETKRQAALPLRAAATDDNVAFDAFVRFLSTWGDREGTAGYEHVEVRDRRHVRVVDAEGQPVPAAKVVVRAKGRKVWAGRTYGDGRTTLYARSAFRRPSQSELHVEAEHLGVRARARVAGDETLLTLDVVTDRPARIPLDVCFLIDTTGSMEDEINRIKATLLAVTERVRARHPGVDLRYGAVLYRDRGDAYVTMQHDFTSNVRRFERQLSAIEADGGGDTPESLNAGLARAVNRLDWRAGAAKVAFLVADAPPHMDYRGEKTYGASMRAALAKGIRVHAVAASGLSQLGTLVFRQIAQYTRGKFIFIQYGSRAASKAEHGVTSQVETNDLDAIIFDRIDAEVAGWGR